MEQAGLPVCFSSLQSPTITVTRILTLIYEMNIIVTTLERTQYLHHMKYKIESNLNQYKTPQNALGEFTFQPDLYFIDVQLNQTK